MGRLMRPHHFINPVLLDEAIRVQKCDDVAAGKSYTRVARIAGIFACVEMLHADEGKPACSLVGSVVRAVYQDDLEFSGRPLPLQGGQAALYRALLVVGYDDDRYFRMPIRIAHAV